MAKRLPLFTDLDGEQRSLYRIAKNHRVHYWMLYRRVMIMKWPLIVAIKTPPTDKSSNSRMNRWRSPWSKNALGARPERRSYPAYDEPDERTEVLALVGCNVDAWSVD